MTEEQTAAVVAVIRTLGFVGGAHYCPTCMNLFHEDRGQHQADCDALAAMKDDEEWWDEVQERLS